MKHRLIASVCTLGIIALAGCASLTPREMEVVRAHRVPAPLVRKLAEGRVLTPPEIITLSRHDVPDLIIEHHLENAGVDYLITTNDAVRMRQAGVSARVIDAVIFESERFARRYVATPIDASYGFWWIDAPACGPNLYFHGW